MNPVWAFAKSMYCTNLRRNTQRWADSVKQFQQVDISYVELVQVDEPEDNRWLGFNRTMKMVIEKGYATGEPFIIFEDDIMFTPKWKEFEGACKELPEDWDLLYLGGNFIGSDTTVWDMPTKYSAQLALLPNAWQTHAILYSNKAAKFVLDNFNEEGFPVLDEWLRVELMPKGRVFMMNPMICYQRTVWSDIARLYVHYGCHEPGNKYLNTL